MDIYEKKQKLEEYLKSLGSVAVAFSSGVDSTFLLKTAHDILGGNAIAITARSCSFPERELNEAKDFCEKEKIEHIIIDSEELDIAGFSSNPPDRCYICKKELFEKIRKVADEKNITYVIEGSNTDDDGDYRPGLKAVKEAGAKSPLREAGLSKEDIRQLSKEAGLSTWDKPSFACLSSRFVYGEEITKEKLAMVERAEQLLMDEGFRQVRVRIHGDVARIEIEPDGFEKMIIPETTKKIDSALKELGFLYVTLDLCGYQTGSMNKTIEGLN